MKPIHVIVYTCVTVGVLLALFAIIYYVKTAKSIKASRQRMDDLLKALKPGVNIMFAGGLMGVFVSKDTQNSVAKVKLSSGQTIEIALYSISNIIDSK